MSGGVDFGGLDLTGVEDYDGVTFEAMGDGATLGNPQPVERSITSSLLDGSFVVTDSHNNREATFQVWIKAADSAALAYGEKLLFDQCSRRVAFGWTPPDGWGARTVYEAFTSSLEHEFDDLLEMQQLVRSYRLRVVCFPFGFSEDEVVDEAIVAPVSPTTVVISDGTSTTGWTPHAPGSATSTITVVSGQLVVTNWQSSSYIDGGDQISRFDFEANKALTAVDFTATEYVSADLAVTGGTPQFFAEVDGIALDQVSMSLVSVAGGSYLYRTTWRCRDASASTLKLIGVGTVRTPAGVDASPTPTFVIDNVQRSNAVPTAGVTTGRQGLRTVTVTGSARSTGSTSVQHETSGLGDVLLYTSPDLGDGNSPDLSRWLDLTTINANNSEPTNVTGRGYLRNTGAAMNFNVPASSLAQGQHLLMIRAKSAIAAPITWTASTVVGSTLMVTQTGTAMLTDAYSLVRLGTATLPTVDLPAGTTAVVRISLSSAQQLSVDELWSFYLGENSALTQVACGVGTPALGTVHNRLFLDAPSIANEGREGLFLGTQADKGDAFHAGPFAASWESMRFAPPVMRAFVVTTGAVDPLVAYRHVPAWHTHAAE